MAPDIVLHHRLDELDGEVAEMMSTVRDLRRSLRLRLGAGRAILAMIAGAALTAAAPASSRVRAPFVVEDDARMPVFSVNEAPARGFTVYDLDGQAVIAATAVALSSSIKVLSPAVKATPTQKGSVQGANQVLIGQVEGKTAGAWFRTGGPTNDKLSIAVVNGKPALDMGTSIVNLTQGESGGGLLQLGDANGTEVAAFGVHPQGVGVVRTRPLGDAGVNLGKTAIFRGSGFPATFICGMRCATGQ